MEQCRVVLQYAWTIAHACICRNNFYFRRTNIISKDVKAVYRSFLPLFAAVWLQQLLGVFVNLLDNFMLGAYAESAMSGATIVNQLQTLIANIVFGVGSGVAVLGSQYWGKGDIQSIKKIFAAGLRISLCFGIIFTVATALFPSQILSIFTNDALILAEAESYASIICWTYVIYSISFMLMVSMQSVETAFVGTIMSGCTIVINGCLNYILIYGNFGAPALGIKGAAYATLASRCVELIVVVLYILLIDKKLRLKFKDFFVSVRGFFSDFIKVAAPSTITGALWGIGLAAQTTILGHMGSAVIGASSIALTVAQIFLCIDYSACSATGVTVGKLVGSGKIDVLKKFTKVHQLFLVCLGIFAGGLLLILKDAIIGLYNVSPETIEYASSFLIIMSIAILGACYEYPVMGGIIAGGGNTKYQAIIDNTFMWILTIPLAALSAFVFNWPPIVTFAILKADQILKCIPNAIYCNTYKWIKDWTKK